MAERWGGRQLTHRFGSYPQAVPRLAMPRERWRAIAGSVLATSRTMRVLAMATAWGWAGTSSGAMRRGVWMVRTKLREMVKTKSARLVYMLVREVVEHVRGDFRTLFGRMSSLAAGFRGSGFRDGGTKVRRWR